MIEFLNEANLTIDYPQARHQRRDMAQTLSSLAAEMRAAGDRHIVESGNSRPRPSAEHLATGRGWKVDAPDEFLAAVDAETPSGVDVSSLHVYPEEANARPWTGADALKVLPLAVRHGLGACKPVWIGEFGAQAPDQRASFICRVKASEAQLSAVWGFGRFKGDPLAFGLDDAGKKVLAAVGSKTNACAEAAPRSSAE